MESKATSDDAVNDSTAPMVGPIRALTLQQLTGEQGSFEGYFNDCYKNCVRIDCPMHHNFRSVTVPSDYKITLYSKDQNPQGFKPWESRFGTPSTRDTAKYIDTRKKILYFGYIHCPRCATYKFMHELRVKIAEELRSNKHTEVRNENIRWIGQTIESSYRGLYQSIGDIWNHLEKNAHYRDLRNDSYGNWKTIEPRIPGMPPTVATHTYIPSSDDESFGEDESLPLYTP